jgi:predicted RNase H-like HicB family nuclease
LELPYHVSLVHDRDEDGAEGWVAEVDELPGCVSQGASPNEAVENLADAMLGWISVALEDGKEIPAPYEEPEYSGRFLVRLPRSLHAELAQQAQREGVSLNQFVAAALGAAVHWRTGSALHV